MYLMSALVIGVCVSLFVGAEGIANPRKTPVMNANDQAGMDKPDPNPVINPVKNTLPNAVVNPVKKPLPNPVDNADKRANQNDKGNAGKINENLKKKWGRMFDYYNMNRSDDRINKADLDEMGAQLIAYGYTAEFSKTVVDQAIMILGDALRYLPPTPTRSPDVGVTKEETIMIFQKQMENGTLKNDEYRKALFNLLLKQPGCKNGKLSGDVVRIFEIGMGLDGASAKRTTELIDDFQISMRAYVNAYAVYFTDTSSYASLEKFPLYGL